MKTIAIINPKAGMGGWTLEKIRPLLKAFSNIVIEITKEAADVETLTKQAAAQDYETIIVGGGDGTIHQAVNAVMQNPVKPRLGILPLGTGNDVCRSLGISTNVAEAASTLAEHKTASLDILEIIHSSTQYCLNGVTMGLRKRHKKGGKGKLSYVEATLPELFHPEVYTIVAAGAHGETIEEEIYALAVMNGQYVGAGIPVSPVADMEDGLLDAVFFKAVSTPQAVKVGARLAAKKHLDDENVVHLRTPAITLRSSPPLLLRADGENIGRTPAKINVLPHALEVIVGA